MALPFSSREGAGLVDQAVATLRMRIIEGVYGPDGEFPPQAELCEELGVSRGVIREAMQRLQSQRLVEVGQGRKPRVLPAGPTALAESLQLVMDRTDASWSQVGEVRRTLEVDIAGLAALRGQPNHWRELEKTLGAMQATDDIAAQVEADMRFHRILAEATGNSIFAFLLDALASLLRASRERTIGKGGIEPALRGHRHVLDAVRRHDAAAARQAMAAHLEESQRDLQSES
jgi:DNA-binding FadR family transcriptional regulator